VLNRKNALFAGHDEGAENWACIASLIETCKLNGADPQAYFAPLHRPLGRQILVHHHVSGSAVSRLIVSGLTATRL
jgi:glucose-6-phosphate 1-dehydrogenase